MAKQCQICEKKSTLVWNLEKLRGKYNPTVKYRKRPNLQWVRIPLETKRKLFKDFRGKRVLACTKCIKALSKTK